MHEFVDVEQNDISVINDVNNDYSVPVLEERPHYESITDEEDSDDDKSDKKLIPGLQHNTYDDRSSNDNSSVASSMPELVEHFVSISSSIIF